METDQWMLFRLTNYTCPLTEAESFCNFNYRGPAKITLMKPKVFRNVVPMSNTWQETWLTNSL